MSVPLGHKNHKSSRNSKETPSIILISYPQERKRIGDFEISKDGKRFCRLHGIHRENVVLPKGIEIAYFEDFIGSYVKSITLPKSIVSFSSNKKELLCYYESKKKENTQLGVHYELSPKIVIVNDKKLHAELQEKINRLRVPEYLKSFLLRKEHTFSHRIVDSFGVEFLDNSYLLRFPLGLKKYDIPEGVRTMVANLKTSDIEEITIPSTLGVSFGDFDSSKLKIIRFVVSNERIMHSCSMNKAVNLEKILVPKGSIEHYTKQFEYELNNDRFHFVIEEY